MDILNFDRKVKIPDIFDIKTFLNFEIPFSFMNNDNQL